MGTTVRLWGPVALWAGIIFILSSISVLPKTEIIWWDFLLKKSAHVFEYAVFFYLLVRAFTKQNYTHISRKTWLTVFIIAVLYAISDEYHQSFVLGRTSKVTDVGFDTLGMLISQRTIKQKLQGK